MPREKSQPTKATAAPPVAAKYKSHARGFAEVDPSMSPSIDLLNSVALFQRRIKFAWVRRRGLVVQAGFADGRIAEWFSATDLRTFARSQDILLQATDFLMPTPPRRSCTEIWEPIAQLIRDISKQDADEMAPALKDEFEQIIRSTWIKAGAGKRAYTSNPDGFFEILKECQTKGRNPNAEIPLRTCVWAGGNGESAVHYCWIYQEALIDWLSTPWGKNRQYAWDTVRNALLMLGFVPIRLHRSYGGEAVTVRVWRGPIDLLVDDDTTPDSPIS